MQGSVCSPHIAQRCRLRCLLPVLCGLELWKAEGTAILEGAAIALFLWGQAQHSAPDLD